MPGATRADPGEESRLIAAISATCRMNFGGLVGQLQPLTDGSSRAICVVVAPNIIAIKKLGKLEHQQNGGNRPVIYVGAILSFLFAGRSI